MSETTKNLKSFNVLLENTGASQISYFVISELNRLTEKNPNIDAVVFYENQHKNCISCNFATMQISEAWGANGPVIATSFSTAHKLLAFPSERKVFYVWDLEWIRGGGAKQYEGYRQVYCDKSLELVARSEYHKNVIENVFNREVKHVVSDFQLDKMLEILQ